MRSSPGQHFLILIGGLVAMAGLLAWIGVAWRAIADLDSVTPEGAEGGRLMLWALTGTVLMILGMIILHFAQNKAD
jgi:uncharacterized membrane protein YidH (DUF202 family)